MEEAERLRDELAVLGEILNGPRGGKDEPFAAACSSLVRERVERLEQLEADLADNPRN